MNGFPLDIGLHKGPGLQLKCCGENIVNVFSVLESTFKDLLAQGREAQYVRNTMKADGARELLETVPTWALRRDRSAAANSDTGKIRFDIGKEAYVITYIDADGVQHTVSRGLHVPRADAGGRVYSLEDRNKIKVLVLKKARTMWNTLDETDTPRLEDGED